MLPSTVLTIIPHTNHEDKPTQKSRNLNKWGMIQINTKNKEGSFNYAVSIELFYILISKLLLI